MQALGSPPLWPPSVEAASIDALQALWRGAGLEQIETREISVRRTFADFDSFWAIAQTGPRIAPRIAKMAPADVQLLRERLQARLIPDADGRISYAARANAVKGWVR